MKVIKSYVRLVVLAVIALILWSMCAVVVRPNEHILIKQFGAVKRVVSEPGLTFKIPFLQSVQSVPKYKMCYDLAPSDITTSDKKIMRADSFCLWEVTDPLKYVTTLSASKTSAEGRIDNVVYNSINTVMSSMKQDDIISGRDGELVSIITKKVEGSLDRYGIGLYQVETKMLDLPDDNKDIVFQRMISERNSIAAGYTASGKSQADKIRNETEKEIELKLSSANAEAAKLRAEGEAEYMKILSDAYSNEDKAAFYEYLRGLDTLKSTMTGNNKSVVLDENSELARLLVGE